MPRLTFSTFLLCFALLASCGKTTTPPATPTAHTQPQIPQTPLATSTPGPASPAPADAQSAPSQAQFVQLINTSATDAVRLLNAMFATSPRGTLFADADTRTNTVVLTGTPDAITRARETLQQIEMQSSEPVIASPVFFIHPIDHTQAQDLAPILNQLFGSTAPSANTTPKGAPALTRTAYFVANPDTNSLLVTTDAHLEDSVRNLIRQFDHAPTVPPATRPGTN